MATIQGIYIALFGRPADPAGLAFFNDATNDGADLTAIGDLAGTEEYLGRFRGMEPAEIISEIFSSLFEREADSGDLAYWVEEWESGRATINDIAIQILDGARNDDLLTVNAKIAAANLFLTRLDLDTEIDAYSGRFAESVGRDFINTVTKDDSATFGEADSAILRLFPDQGQQPGGNPGGGGGTVVVPPSGDTTAPSLHITLFDSATIELKFSEDVVDFTADDISYAGQGSTSDLTAVNASTFRSQPTATGAEIFVARVENGSYTDVAGNAGKGATFQIGYGQDVFSGTELHDSIYVTGTSAVISSTQGSDYVVVYRQEAQTTFRWLDTAHSGVGGELITVDFSELSFFEGSVFNVRLAGEDFQGAAALIASGNPALSPGGIYEVEATRDANGFFTAQAGDKIRMPTPFTDYTSTGGERSLVVYKLVDAATDTVDLYFDANGNGDLDAGDGQIRMIGFANAGLSFGPDAVPV